MKKYISFLLPRMVSCVLIAAVVYGISVSVLYDKYKGALERGYTAYYDRYTKMLSRYDEGVIDGTFLEMYTNFFYNDYVRFAKVTDDGSIETIYETDYDVIPVCFGVKEWIYVTDNEELLALGSRHYQNDETGFYINIDYKKCDDVQEIIKNYDTYLLNTFDCMAISDGYYNYPYDLFYIASELSGYCGYHVIGMKSYYTDGDTLYLGKVEESFADGGTKRPFGKEWDFTDQADQSKYITSDEPFGGVAEIRLPRVRPDKFFESKGDLFNCSNIEELKQQIAKYSDEDAIADSIWYCSDEEGEGGRKLHAVIREYEAGGNTYLVEYIVTTAGFTEYYRPFLIAYAVIMLVTGIAVSLLISIRPYRRYRRAYEDNAFKNNLIDTLAHNLKTPLMVLGGYAENLKDVSSAEDKNRYADQILAKSSEMNKDIEAILKTAGKNSPVLTKGSVKEVLTLEAAKLGIDIAITGDMTLKMDKEYIDNAIYCLIDNANRYKTADSSIEAVISSKSIVIRNKTELDKFTPGTGLAIAGRIIAQHGLRLETDLKDGVFEAKIIK